MESLKLKPMKPEFKALVRSGGKCDVITIPSHLTQYFDIAQGDSVLIEIKGIEKGKAIKSTAKNLWTKPNHLGPLLSVGRAIDQFSALINQQPEAVFS